MSLIRKSMMGHMKLQGKAVEDMLSCLQHSPISESPTVNPAQLMSESDRAELGSNAEAACRCVRHVVSTFAAPMARPNDDLPVRPCVTSQSVPRVNYNCLSSARVGEHFVTRDFRGRNGRPWTGSFPRRTPYIYKGNVVCTVSKPCERCGNT